MNSSQESKKSRDYYTPVPYLKAVIKDLLQVQKKRQRVERKKYAGKDITSEEDALAKMENRTNRKKNNVLNRHVFQSMANLTFLLEQMQKEPYIRERFEDDIKALFFAESTVIENKEPIFLRFLKSCVCESPDGALPEDFRLILCHYLQWAASDMITHTSKFINRYRPHALESVLFEDIKRSLAWISFLSPDRIPEFDKETRPALF